MLNVIIQCDDCNVSSTGNHESITTAIDQWTREGGVISPFTKEALCPRCYTKLHHPSKRKQNSHG